jgi:CRP-like cAMP-binding protein
MASQLRWGFLVRVTQLGCWQSSIGIRILAMPWSSAAGLWWVTVPASVFHAAMATDATLARALSMRLAKHARILLTKISIVASGPVQVRLATLLLSLAERYGDELDDGSTCVPVDLTRKTMGEFIEARVETVIRMLSVWQRDGVIADSDRGVLITNMELLRQRAASA